MTQRAKEMFDKFICQYCYTLQGEGINTGTPVFLVRFNGCPFNCEFCDTKYSWSDVPEKLSDREIKDIAHRLLDLYHETCYKHKDGRDYSIAFYVPFLITGGEPLYGVSKRAILARLMTIASGSPFLIETSTLNAFAEFINKEGTTISNLHTRLFVTWCPKLDNELNRAEVYRFVAKVNRAKQYHSSLAYLREIKILSHYIDEKYSCELDIIGSLVTQVIRTYGNPIALTIQPLTTFDKDGNNDAKQKLVEYATNTKLVDLIERLVRWMDIEGLIASGYVTVRLSPRLHLLCGFD